MALLKKWFSLISSSKRGFIISNRKTYDSCILINVFGCFGVQPELSDNRKIRYLGKLILCSPTMSSYIRGKTVEESVKSDVKWWMTRAHSRIADKSKNKNMKMIFQSLLL
ncbi:hypothetical protein CEXT_37681 [Caerostris extrusa]|uniref:Uncharacterized protein n=1 Tax=Caerostris extrusa TaxID=172846 RepID=A0AAV4R6X0_CAEEX|nr:hypothetical protein CEXT_37681 [Caerostris extrusa]